MVPAVEVDMDEGSMVEDSDPGDGRTDDVRWFGLEIGGGAGGPKSFPRQSQQTKEGAKVLDGLDGEEW